MPADGGSPDGDTDEADAATATAAGDATVLFVGLAVSDFPASVDWYTRLFGRPPDVPVHEREVMWRVTDGGWLYIVADAPRAGRGLADIAVDDLDAALVALRTRGLAPHTVGHVGDAGRKATFEDPDGNRFSLIEVARQ